MIKTQGTMALIVNGNMAVTVGETGGKSTTAEATKAIIKVNGYGSTYEVAYANWGSNNRRPQDILVEMNKSGIAKAGLRVRTNAHYGSGPLYYRNWADGSNQAPQPVSNIDTKAADALAFDRAVRMAALLKEVIMNFEWWGMAHVECLVNDNATRITSARCLKSAWVRHSLISEESGRIEWAVFNPNWERGDNTQAKLVPMADPWWTADELRAWLKKTGFRKFVFPTFIPDADMGYYPDLEWHALYDNGWLKQTNSIPSFKDAMFKNQINIKWHIKIPKNYWPARFGEDNWAQLSPADKEVKKGEVYGLIFDYLGGAANAGKALITELQVDDMGQPLPGWEVIPLDDKLKDGAFLPDANKGNSEILASMLVDPTLLGQGASGSLGAGSGSDKREAYTILNALLYTSREQTVEWWNLVSRFNNWDPTLVLGYKNIMLTTLDVNPTGSQKVTV